MKESEITTRSILTLLILSIIWGSSFILIKKALVSFEPLQLACMRISISAISFFPILMYNRKKVPWDRWKLFLLIGLCGTGIPAFMYFIAQTKINSTSSGVLNSLTPIFTLLFSVFLFKNRLHPSKYFGVFIGFVGAAVLSYFGSEAGGKSENIWYSLFVVIGTMCYGLSGNLVKEFFQDVRSLIISATSFCMIGPPAIAYLFYTRFYESFDGSPAMWTSVWSILFLSLVGTVSASIVFYKLVQETNAVFASSVAYLMPLVAILLGFLDGEAIGWPVFVGMFLILFGVYIIRKKFEKATSTA